MNLIFLGWVSFSLIMLLPLMEVDSAESDSEEEEDEEERWELLGMLNNKEFS